MFTDYLDTKCSGFMSKHVTICHKALPDAHEHWVMQEIFKKGFLCEKVELKANLSTLIPMTLRMSAS